MSKRKIWIIAISTILLFSFLIGISVMDGINTNSKKYSAVTKNGDTLTIDFVGKINGKKFDGGSANGQELVLGSNTFIPGFENQLINHKINDIVEVKVKFPKEYQVKEYSGKEAIFTTTIKDIKENKNEN